MISHAEVRSSHSFENREGVGYPNYGFCALLASGLVTSPMYTEYGASVISDNVGWALIEDMVVSRVFA